MYYSKPQPKTSPVGTVLDSSCFRQVEFAGVLRARSTRPRAGKLVDFMLSREVPGRRAALQMFVFPVRNDVALPPVFEQFAEVSPEPVTLPPEQISTSPRRVDRAVDATTVLR